MQGTYQNYQQVPVQNPSYPMQYQQSQQGSYGHSKIMADGAVEAQNRLLMMYQPNQLVPGFVSDTVWDVNGRQFYALSIENDGRRNFETFDYSKHEDSRPIQIDGAQFVSRQEYDEFVAKVSAALEVINGVRAAVPTTVTSIAAQGANVTTEAVDAGGHVGGGVGTPAK